MANKFEIDPDFPEKLSDKGLNAKIKEYLKLSEDNLETDKIYNIVTAMWAQIGLAELQKRENNRAAKTASCFTKIAFWLTAVAIILSGVGIGIQYSALDNPMIINDNDIAKLSVRYNDVRINQKLDSLSLEQKHQTEIFNCILKRLKKMK